MKLYILYLSLIFSFFVPDVGHAQFLNDLFSKREDQTSASNRDDLPNSGVEEDELTFDDLICRDKEQFPKKVYSKKFLNYNDCKNNLDRIQDATYIDLTYRIRWDNDRLDLYRTSYREILICDQEEMSIYEHDQKKDPDWWMIVRNSIDYVICSEEIYIESLD